MRLAKGQSHAGFGRMIALPVATVGSLRLRKGWKGTEGDPPALISQLALGVGVFEPVV